MLAIDTMYSDTLDSWLRVRARESAAGDAFTFVDGSCERIDGFDYAELDRRARAIAHALRRRGARQQRVLLLFLPGLDFVAAFYGCMYAGAVAVPAYPPDPARLARTLPRLQAIASDSAPTLALTTSPLRAMARQVFALAPELAAIDWLAVDELTAPGESPEDVPAGLAPRDLALLQYTSGSTALPRGVMISHGNALANMRMLCDRSDPRRTRVHVSWLPTYHDLGLMGGVLLPLMTGGRSILMSPLEFLRRPSAWLAAIQRYRGTDTYAPNFAFDLCVRKISAAERAGLELDSMEVCVLGAEPIRHATVEQFLAAFEPHGFARSAMYPGYGLAEAVVGVSCGPVSEPLRSVMVDAGALARGRVAVVGAAHPRAHALIGCGRALDHVRIEVVNPETAALAGPGEVGELWIEGPNVALGYWGRADETRATFGARLGDGSGRALLRSGDLGFVHEGHVYVAGRLKDVIVVRGANHYPQDLEETIERCHPQIGPGAVIACAVERAGAEHLAIIAEVSAGTSPDEHDRVVAAIRAAVRMDHGIEVHELALIKPRTIDKTSSGKLARQRCKQRYLDHALDPVHLWTRPESAAPPPREPHPAGDDVTAFLARELGRHGVGAAALAPGAKLAELALDSLAIMELAGRLEADLQVKLSASELLALPTLGALEQRVRDARATEPAYRGDGAALTQAIALRGVTSRAPLFCVGGLGGLATYLRTLADALDRAPR